MSKLPKIRPPFPLAENFPGRIERTSYRISNAIYNSFYPVHPFVFGASTAGFAVYYAKHPDSRILNIIPEIGIRFEKHIRLGLVSFASAYIPVFISRLTLTQFYFKYRGFLYDDPKSPSFTTRVWALIGGALNVLSKPRLLSCDTLLPSPSVPPLEQTVGSYLQSIKAICSEDEKVDIERMGKAFLEGEGANLQKYAQFYSVFVENYVTGFWEEFAYLYNRECLLISSSVAHGDFFNSPPVTQAVMAANLVYIEAQICLAIDRQTFVPPKQGMMCARKYERLFCHYRVPGEEVDKLEKHELSQYVTVLFNGGIYKVDFARDNGRLYTVEELTEVFNELLSRKSTQISGAEGKIAALTHDRRAMWAHNRERFFLKISKNRETLEMIESAAFMLVLDDDDCDYNASTSEGASHFMTSMLTGNGTNRWVDKCAHHVATKSGRFGAIGEHSAADGLESDHVLETFHRIYNNKLKQSSMEDQLRIASELDVEEMKNRGVKLAGRLEIQMLPGMAEEIDRCYNTYTVARSDVDLVSFIFSDWGKGRIKNFRVSPDAFVQMAIQLAQFKDQGRFVHTYESASSRFYRNSRTETLRTVTDESCVFVKAMMEGNTNRECRASLLRKAIEVHVRHNRDCMANKGADRHLFVLFVLSKALGVSSPFLDYFVKQEWLLSTSNLPTLTNYMNEDTNPHLPWIGGCFAAVAKNGYGVCYRFAGDHSICVHVSSYHSAENTNSSRFLQHLTDSFREMSEQLD